MLGMNGIEIQWFRRDRQVVMISLVDRLLNSVYSVNILFKGC